MQSVSAPNLEYLLIMTRSSCKTTATSRSLWSNLSVSVPVEDELAPSWLH